MIIQILAIKYLNLLLFQNRMTPEQKLALIKRNTQEIVTEAELLDLLKKKKQPVVYRNRYHRPTAHRLLRLGSQDG